MTKTYAIIHQNIFFSFFHLYPPNLPSHKEDTVHVLGQLGPSAREGAARLDAVHFGAAQLAAATSGYDCNGYTCNWVRAAMGCGLLWGAGCYGVWAARVRLQLGAGCKWMLPQYNWVRLKLGAIATGAHIQLCVRATAGWGYNWVRLFIRNNLIILFQA